MPDDSFAPCVLGDLADFRNGKGLSASRYSADGRSPVFGANGLIARTNELLNPLPVIVVGRVGAYCGNVYLADEPSWVTDNAIVAVPKAGVDLRFLYYLMKALDLKHTAIGSAQPLITQGGLKLVSALAPSLEQQEVIGRILGALDDKIELNRRMNETLEAIARAIFKSWFFDFDPVRRNVARSRNQPSPPAPLPKGEGAHYRGGYEFAGLLETARELRRKQTPAEEILWEVLRNRRFLGVKFRRQRQVGDYIVDFYCHEHRLVVELDGPVHGSEHNVKKDSKRDAYLRSLGLTVVRFPNKQVLDNLERVVEKIAAAVRPLPGGEGQGEGVDEARFPSPSGRRVGDEGAVEALDRLFPDSFQDSPLGKIPRGWQDLAVENVVEVGGGSTPSTKESSFWDGDIYWATPKDLSTLHSPVLFDTGRKITEAGLQQIGSRLFPKGSVLLSSRAPIGYLAITEVPVAVNQGMIAMVCERTVSNQYMLHWTHANMDIIEGRASGTTFQELSKSSFRSIPIMVPSEGPIKAFTEKVEILHRRVVSNLQESRTLAALRDALLPKLISGELRVVNPSRFVEGIA